MESILNGIKSVDNYYLTNDKDSGSKGKAGESILRNYFTGRWERVHPQTTSDVKGKGFALEVKSGAGWLINPCYDSKEQAQAAAQALNRLNAQLVAYTVEGYNGESDLLRFIDETRVISSAAFIAILHSLNLVIAKKGSSGLWGIAIQVVKTSKKKRAALEAMLNENGITIDEAAEKYNFI